MMHAKVLIVIMTIFATTLLCQGAPKPDVDTENTSASTPASGSNASPSNGVPEIPELSEKHKNGDYTKEISEAITKEAEKYTGADKECVLQIEKASAISWMKFMEEMKKLTPEQYERFGRNVYREALKQMGITDLNI